MLDNKRYCALSRMRVIRRAKTNDNQSTNSIRYGHSGCKHGFWEIIVQNNKQKKVPQITVRLFGDNLFLLLGWQNKIQTCATPAHTIRTTGMVRYIGTCLCHRCMIGRLVRTLCTNRLWASRINTNPPCPRLWFQMDNWLLQCPYKFRQRRHTQMDMMSMVRPHLQRMEPTTIKINTFSCFTPFSR